MFAVVVSGRLVQTDFQQVDSNKFLINIPSIDEVNHIAVFMTGTQPLPADMGASSKPFESKVSIEFRLKNFKVSFRLISVSHLSLDLTVHFSWPDPNRQVSIWRCLGVISNDKPSAIFRITNYKGTAEVSEIRLQASVDSTDSKNHKPI